MFTRHHGYWSKPETNFFNKLHNSQREDWYTISIYVAEFWCTVSNIPFLVVAYWHVSWELLFAAVASIVSHTVPKQWLLMVDKFGVLVAFSKLVRNYKVIDWQIGVLICVVAAINRMDMWLARRQKRLVWPWPHVLWHVSCACVAHIVLTKLRS